MTHNEIVINSRNFEKEFRNLDSMIKAIVNQQCFRFRIDDRQDIYSEVVYRIYKQVRKTELRFPQTSKLRSYVYAYARNVRSDFIYKNKREIPTDSEIIVNTPARSTIENDFMRNEIIDIILSFLNDLYEEDLNTDRSNSNPGLAVLIFSERMFADKTEAQIASELEIHRSRVNYEFRKVVARLRSRLISIGIDQSSLG